MSTHDPLQLVFAPGWRELPRRDANDPRSFSWSESERAGVLQLSVKRFQGGRAANPSQAQLMEMAAGYGRHLQWGQPYDPRCGSAALGNYGSAAFPGPGERRSIMWMLSNGQDIVLATYIAEASEDPGRAEEARAMVMALQLRQPFAPLG